MNPANDFQRDELLTAARNVTVAYDFAERIIPLLDLTDLNENAATHDIQTLCHAADTPLGKVAAVCIYPQFVKFAHSLLADSGIKIATVANFPHGSADLSATLAAIDAAIGDGAQEIDIVMPYCAFLAGDEKIIFSFTQACKKACGDALTLKIILETGVLQGFDKIKSASLAAIAGGADFIKTSTGKTAVGATLETTLAMLIAIKASKSAAGFKAAGGIRTAQQAASYLFLVENILGNEWLTPDKTRIGASSLLKELINDKQFKTV